MGFAAARVARGCINSCRLGECRHTAVTQRVCGRYTVPRSSCAVHAQRPQRLRSACAAPAQCMQVYLRQTPAARRTGIPPASILRSIRLLAAVYRLARTAAPTLATGLPRPADVLAALRTADPSPGSDDYTPPPWRRPPLQRHAPTWKPIGHCGSHRLTPAQLRDAFDTTKCRPHSDPPPAPTAPAMTSATQSFIDDMLAHNLISPVDPSRFPPTGTLHIIPKSETKSRAIFDARPLNYAQPHPPRRFTLPSFTNLKVHLLSAVPPLFTTIDISNFYWSCLLPNPNDCPDTPAFVFHVSRCPDLLAYRINALPFGWDAAPYIAQSISTSIISNATHRCPDFASLIYMDDILTISHSHEYSTSGHHNCVAALRDNHFIDHPTKTVDTPSHRTVWIGKSISSTPPSIGPTTKAAATTIAATL
eukprot:gene57557-biopygen5788